MVKVGDPLVEIDPRPYQVMQEQAEGQLAKDQASLVQGKQDLQRDQQLIAAKATTPQVLDAQVSTVGQLSVIKTDQAGDRQRETSDYLLPHHRANFRSHRLASSRQRQPGAGGGRHDVSHNHAAPADDGHDTIPQDDIFRVQQKFNTHEDVAVEAWNRDLATKLATGKLEAIDNQVDTATGHRKAVRHLLERGQPALPE